MSTSASTPQSAAKSAQRSKATNRPAVVEEPVDAVGEQVAEPKKKKSKGKKGAVAEAAEPVVEAVVEQVSEPEKKPKGKKAKVEADAGEAADASDKEPAAKKPRKSKAKKEEVAEDGKKPKKNKRSVDPNRVKKLSPYIMFCTDMRLELKAEFPDMPFEEVGRTMGAKWAALDAATKQEYIDMSEVRYQYAIAEKAAGESV